MGAEESKPMVAEESKPVKDAVAVTPAVGGASGHVPPRSSSLRHGDHSTGGDTGDDAGVRALKGSKAVLVTDMSGFTRVTRQKGVIHFASLIAKMRQILNSVFAHYGAHTVETEADNFFVVFNDAPEALDAALAVYDAIKQFNASIDENWNIKIGGVGLSYGPHVLQDRATGKLYGVPVDQAFLLGEDVASNQEVLVSEAFYERVHDLAQFHHLEFTRKLLSQDDDDDVVRVEAAGAQDTKAAAAAAATRQGYFEVSGASAHPFEYRPAALSKPTNKFFAALLKRFEASVGKLQAIDKRLQAQYMRPATVVMFGVDWAVVTASHGAEAMIRLRQAVYDTTKPIVQAYNGQCVEEALLVFKSNIDALAATLELRQALVDHNAAHGADAQVPVTGFGIHSGTLLIAEGTDVHWGDPVNTASKLGEDYATARDILITEAVHADVSHAPGFATLGYEPQSVTISKVQLSCFRVVCEEDVAATSATATTTTTTTTTTAAAAANATAAADVVESKVEELRRFPDGSAIVVTDMSGFTRLTRAYGVIHFAGLIMKMRQIIRALFKAHRAVLITTEADNCFGVFADAEHAVAAALQVYHVMAKYNAAIDKSKDPEGSMTIKIGGVGVGTGAGLVLDTTSHKFSGEPMFEAFALGEDVADAGQVCVSESVWREVKAHPRFSNVEFTEHSDPEYFDGDRVYYSIQGKLQKGRFKFRPESYAAMQDPEQICASVGVAATPEVTKFVSMLMHRVQADAHERARIDTYISQKYLRQSSVVMMGVAWSSVSAQLGLAEMVHAKHLAWELTQGVVEAHGGWMEEESLFVFSEPSAAFAATVALRAAFAAYNDAPEQSGAGTPLVVPVTGFGIHHGPLLYVHGTDVHWGNPVNTASKLGEDIASGADIYVTHEVLEQVETSAFPGLVGEPISVKVSGVTLEGMRFHDSAAADTAGEATADLFAEADGLRRYHGSVAVVVTDMSGFTRTTRKHGIIQLASLIMRMREVLMTLFVHHGAIALETEADNVFAVFSRAEDAVAAAVQVHTVIQQHNRTLNRDKFRVKLGGVGIGYGPHVVQDAVTGKLFGSPVDRAFVLGEDMAEKGQVLADDGTVAAIAASPQCAGITATPVDVPADGSEEVAPLPHALLTGGIQGGWAFGTPHDPTAASEEARETLAELKSSAFVRMLLERFACDSTSRAALDERLRAEFMVPATVVMYGVDWSTQTQMYGVEHTVQLKQRAHAMVQDVCAAHNGECVEETLFVFPTVADGVYAAIALKQAFEVYNAEAPHADSVPVFGYGVHTGELLFASGTDVHWGDAVNTASKLGEDVASGGQLLITQEVFQAFAETEGDRMVLEVKQGQVVVSKVRLVMFEVIEATPQTPPLPSPSPPSPSPSNGQAAADPQASADPQAAADADSDGVAGETEGETEGEVPRLLRTYRRALRLWRTSEEPEESVEALARLAQLAGPIAHIAFKVRRSKVNCLEVWAGGKAGESAASKAKLGSFYQAQAIGEASDLNRSIELGNEFLQVLESHTDKTDEELVQLACRGISSLLVNGASKHTQLCQVAVSLLARVCESSNVAHAASGAAAIGAMVKRHIPGTLAALVRGEHGLGWVLGVLEQSQERVVRRMARASAAVYQQMKASGESGGEPVVLQERTRNRGKVVIGAGQQAAVQVSVESAGAVVLLRVFVPAMDVGVSVVYQKRANADVQVMVEEEIVVGGGGVWWEQMCVCGKPGVWGVVLNNDYSWWNQKEVVYDLRVVSPPSAPSSPTV